MTKITTPMQTMAANQSTPLGAIAEWEHWSMEQYWMQNGDPRVLSLPFMSSFRVPFSIGLLYLFFVLYAGPRFMRRRREPFSLRTTLLVYNCAMTIANFYFFARVIINYEEVVKRALDFRFPGFTAVSEWDHQIIRFHYTYVVSKFVDLLDTIFFVLRKKQSQITALHLYHHTSVALLGWVSLRLQAFCNIGVPFCVMNSFLHTLMYSYYALAAAGPSMRRYLWWKRYLTQLQIAQFIILFIHSAMFITMQSGYNSFFTVNYIINTIVYIVLFTRFYVQTYRTKAVADAAEGDAKSNKYQLDHQRKQHKSLKGE